MFGLSRKQWAMWWLTSCSTTGQELPRYAGKGFALDCLSQPMKIPFLENYGYFNIKAGTVTCPDGAGGSYGSGRLLAALLVILHVVLVLAPVAVIPFFYTRYRTQTRAKAFELLLAAMAVFCIASLGEVTQHIHDNWLYLGLIPTYNTSIFYGGLAMGQAMLAGGLGGFGFHAAADLVVGLLVLLSLAIAAALSQDVPAPNTLESLPSVFIFVFAGLGLTTLGYIVKSFRSFGGVCKRANWFFTLGVVVAYAAGIVGSLQIQSSGNQLWHPFVAASFITGFGLQVWWLGSGMSLPE